MTIQRKIKIGRGRRALRVRAKLDYKKPRVSVFRSLQHIYAQLIDDQQGRTLASCSSIEGEHFSAIEDKKQQAFAVGKELARRAQVAGVTQVVFDRGRFLYHGRIKSLADGLREGGLSV